MNLLSHLNPLDLILALIVVISTVRALLRGFFREAFSLIGSIAGFALACWYYQRLAPHFATFIHRPALAQLAAFIIIFATVVIAAALLAHAFRKTASAVGLGFADRLLGGIFGLIRGGILSLAILLAITAFVPSAPWLKTSFLAPYFLRAAHAVSFIMPSELKRRMVEGSRPLNHTAARWINSGPSSQN